MKNERNFKKHVVRLTILGLSTILGFSIYHRVKLGGNLVLLAALLVWLRGFADGESPSKKRSAVTGGLVFIALLIMFAVPASLGLGGSKDIGKISGMEADKVQSVHARLELEGGLMAEGMIQGEAAAQIAKLVSGWEADKKGNYYQNLPPNRFLFVATVDGFQKTWMLYFGDRGSLQYEGVYYDITSGDYDLEYLKRCFEGSWTDGPLSLFFPSLPNVEEITAYDSQTGNEYTLEGDRATGLAAALSGLEISLDYGLELDPSILRYRIEFEGGVISLAKNYMVIEPQGKEAVSCHPDGSYDMQALAALLTQ